MIYIGLGSNLAGGYGDCRQLLEAAIEHLHRLSPSRLQVVRVSPFYRSAAIGPSIGAERQPDYVNAVLAAETLLAPAGLLAALHRVEAAFGRHRQVKWGARTLDLDILDYRGIKQARHPILPHPRLHQRAFVLKPLRDIAPAWRHPVSGRHIAQLLAALPPQAARFCLLLPPKPPK